MRTKLLSTFIISTIFLASCSKDDNPSETNDGRVQFTSGVTKIQTKVGGVDGDTWNNGDAIGIYMIEKGEKLSESSIKEGANNVKYTTTSTSTTATFTSTTPIFYPTNGSLVDFRAYHPYSSSAIDGIYWYELDVLEQSNQSAIDFMTASANNNGNGYDKNNTSAVNLNFQHQLSKVIINVSAGDGVGNLSGLDVKVKGMHHTAIFDLTDFVFAGSGTESSPGTFPIITPYSAGGDSYELILLPTVYYKLSACTVEFTVGGNTYVWTMSENSSNITNFESGKKYTFDVTLTKNEVQVSGKIIPWTSVNAGTGTAN